MKDLEDKVKYLGLNKKQSKAYLFILKNKKVYLKELAKHLGITVAGTSKLLKEMIKMGFIKTFHIGNKKVFMSVDISELKKEFLKSKKEQLNRYESIFDELQSGYGGYTIKVFRISESNLIKKYRELSKDCDEILEFVDLTNEVIAMNDELNKDARLKTIYYGENISLPHAKKIDINTDKGYAHIIIINGFLFFITTNKEVLLINNDEISNSLKLLFKNFFNLL